MKIRFLWDDLRETDFFIEKEKVDFVGNRAIMKAVKRKGELDMMHKMLLINVSVLPESHDCILN